MIREVGFNSTEQLTSHINVQELRCKCGGSHNIIFDTELPEKLEQLVCRVAKENNTSTDKVTIIISSGNRCKQHDINVGGNGWGQHVCGKAVDFEIRVNGNPVDSRLIACYAQDLGFNGIGRINNTYIHCDVREPNSRWYGDETVKGGTTCNVTNDYWSYYGFKENDKEDNNEPVKELQEILNRKGYSLAVDGIAGEKTIKALHDFSIENGDSGELCKWVQTRLKSRGYDCGEIDGIVGSRTLNCLNQWQKDVGVGIGRFYGSDWDKFVK